MSDADVLVLIIGDRYGSVDPETGRSVTWLEYMTARAKGIPIYAFIKSDVRSLANKWRLAADSERETIKAQVDNSAIFDFIEEVAAHDGTWINEFASDEDVVATLREQFAFLMMTGLEVQKVLRETDEIQLLNSLSPSAFQMAAYRPATWEYLLFAEVLRAEIARSASLRNIYDLDLRVGRGQDVQGDDFLHWAILRMKEVERLVSATTIIIDVALKQAVGEPGVAGNVRDIVHAGRRLGEIYRDAIEWTMIVRRAIVDDDFVEARDALSHALSLLVENLGRWGDVLRGEIDNAKAVLKTNPGREIQLDLTLKIEVGATYLNDVSNSLARVLERR